MAQPRAADDFEVIRARMASPARLSESDCAQVQFCRQVLRLAPRGPPRGSDAFLTFLRRLSLLIGGTTRTRLGPAVDRGNRNDLPPSGTWHNRMSGEHFIRVMDDPYKARALAISFASAVLSLRADSRAKKSVRPYVSTGVHIIPDNMSVSLANYGIGFSIVTKVAISRGDLKPRGVIFVQDQYCLSPGDSLLLATAKATNQSKAGDALKDWTNALEGVKIVVEYLDIFGEKFQYTRVISTRAIFES